MWKEEKLNKCFVSSLLNWNWYQTFWSHFIWDRNHRNQDKEYIYIKIILEHKHWSIAGFCNVRCLDLSGNHDITSVGWKGLADTLVENKKSRLVNLVYQNSKYAIDQGRDGNRIMGIKKLTAHLAVGVSSIVVMMLMHGENLIKKQTNPKFFIAI